MSAKTLKMPHTVEFGAQWSNSRCLSQRTPRTYTRFVAFFAPRRLAGFFMAKWTRAEGRA